MKFIFRPALLFMALSPLHLWAVTFEGPDGDKFEFAGFTKHEWSRNGANVRVVPDNESTYRTDARNAFWPVPSADQATQLPKNSQLSMQQISLGWSKETTGAVGLEGKLTYRWRSSDVLRGFYSPDVDYRLADGNPLHRDFSNFWVSAAQIWGHSNLAHNSPAHGRVRTPSLSQLDCPASGQIQEPVTASCQQQLGTRPP